MSTTTTPMSIKLDIDIRNRLADLAARRQRTPHAMAREAVVAYVVREEAQDQTNKEALEAWNDYQETGLHTTGDEVLAWLDSWGTANELPAPTSHT